MLEIEEVYLADPRTFELRPFLDRVHELIRLFHDDPVVRLRIVGIISAGRPIEALEEPAESITIRGPLHAVRRSKLLPRLRRFARALSRNASDADDLVQIVVERALRSAEQWQPDSRLDSWLNTIV